MKGVQYPKTHTMRTIINIANTVGVNIPDKIYNVADVLTEWEHSAIYELTYYSSMFILKDLIEFFPSYYEDVCKEYSNIQPDITILNISELLLEVNIKLSDEISRVVSKLNSEIPPKRLNSFGKDKNSRVYNVIKYAIQNSPTNMTIKDTDELIEFIVNVLL